MTNFNPSSLGYIDLKSELVRQVIQDAYVAAVSMIESFAAIPDDEQRTIVVPREIGGLDRSAHQLSKLLGQEEWQRQYHDDGCVIDEADEEAGGHDFETGCELADDGEDASGSEETEEEAGEEGEAEGEGGSEAEGED